MVEAQIGVDDISDVHPNARAEVHLTAYKQRIIPIVHGDVIQVSADRLTDPKSGNPYYTALVRVGEQELAALPNIQLYPGMPAQVMIPITERTAGAGSPLPPRRCVPISLPQHRRCRENSTAADRA